MLIPANWGTTSTVAATAYQQQGAVPMVYAPAAASVAPMLTQPITALVHATVEVGLQTRSPSCVGPPSHPNVRCKPPPPPPPPLLLPPTPLEVLAKQASAASRTAHTLPAVAPAFLAAPASTYAVPAAIATGNAASLPTSPTKLKPSAEELYAAAAAAFLSAQAATSGNGWGWRLPHSVPEQFWGRGVPEPAAAARAVTNAAAAAAGNAPVVGLNQPLPSKDNLMQGLPSKVDTNLDAKKGLFGGLSAEEWLGKEWLSGSGVWGT